MPISRRRENGHIEMLSMSYSAAVASLSAIISRLGHAVAADEAVSNASIFHT